ncbi:hypothetical protein AA313_de0205854 [Arthrobotrys entomopaga]|nr:hypothetical protein AA313_de0205854 [Arthrobotrys entomopaga]
MLLPVSFNADTRLIHSIIYTKRRKEKASVPRYVGECTRSVSQNLPSMIDSFLNLIKNTESAVFAPDFYRRARSFVFGWWFSKLSWVHRQFWPGLASNKCPSWVTVAQFDSKFVIRTFEL